MPNELTLPTDLHDDADTSGELAEEQTQMQEPQSVWLHQKRLLAVAAPLQHVEHRLRERASHSLAVPEHPEYDDTLLILGGMCSKLCDVLTFVLQRL